MTKNQFINYELSKTHGLTREQFLQIFDIKACSCGFSSKAWTCPGWIVELKPDVDLSKVFVCKEHAQKV